MDLRNTKLGQSYYWLLEGLILKKIDFLSPNQITLLGLLLALMVPVFFYVSAWLGLMFLGMSALSDSLDGLVAKRKNKQDLFGAFLDSTVDRVSDLFYLLGIMIWFWNRGLDNLSIVLVFFLAMLITLLISYIKARIEGLGGTCQAGLMDRTFRITYLLFWTFLMIFLSQRVSQVMWGGILIYIFLVAITVGQRIFIARRILQKSLTQS